MSTQSFTLFRVACAIHFFCMSRKINGQDNSFNVNKNKFVCSCHNTLPRQHTGNALVPQWYWFQCITIPGHYSLFKKMLTTPFLQMCIFFMENIYLYLQKVESLYIDLFRPWNFLSWKLFFKVVHYFDIFNVKWPKSEVFHFKGILYGL